MKKPTTKFRRRRKKQFVELFGGKCEICGYDKCIGSLHFHHLDPNEKGGNPHKILYDHSIEVALNELKKCIMVCANCHGEIHSEEYDCVVKINKPLWVKCKCENCGKIFETKKVDMKYCSQKCYQLSQRRCDRPSKDELKVLIENNSWLALGRMFGVSDNAVRKWARSYGIL